MGGGGIKLRDKSQMILGGRVRIDTQVKGVGVEVKTIDHRQTVHEIVALAYF